MLICPDKSFTRHMRVRLKFSITVADLRPARDSVASTIRFRGRCSLKSMQKKLKNLFFPYEVAGKADQFPLPSP